MNLFIIKPEEILEEIKIFLNRDVSIRIIDENLIKISTIVNGRGKSTGTIFPKTVRVKGCVAGLLKGEMLSSIKCKNSFVFANSNPRVIKIVLEFLDSLGFDLSKMSLMLEISCKNITDVEKLKQNAIEFWTINTSIPKENLENNIKLRSEFEPDELQGTITIRIGNTILRALIQILVNNCIEVAKENPNIAIDFIKGLVASEGNVNINRVTRCLRMVRISSKLSKDRAIFKRILKCSGIEIFSKDMKTVSKKEAKIRGWKSNGRGGAVLINRFSNFIKLFEIDAFELCADKEEKFLRGLQNMKSIKNLLRFEKLPERFNLKIMKSTFNLSSKPINTKNNFQELNFIRKVGGSGKACDPFIFELTKRANNILSVLS